MKYHIFLPDSKQFGILQGLSSGDIKYVGRHELDFYGLYSAEYLWSYGGRVHWKIECEPSTLTFLSLKLGIVVSIDNPVLF